MSTLRLFHDDAYCWRFTAQVLSCRPAAGGWDVVLDRTAFYATAGGQPHDTGSLDRQRVSEATVIEETGEIVHRVDGPVAGTVVGAIDAGRRLDHMEQHTGQHILSQACARVLGWETASFHLGEACSTIDLAPQDADPARDALAQAEDFANQIIRENRPVRIHYAEGAAELARFPLRKPPTVTGPVRIVEISGFDWSACGGTHLSSTGQAGLIRIKSWERHKKGLRVTFLCGGRALADYRAVDSMVQDLCQSLSIPWSELPVAVQRLRDEAGRLRRTLGLAQDKLTDAEARALLETVRPTAGGVRVLRMAIGGRPLDEVQALAARVAAQGKAVALFGTRSALPQLVFARSTDLRLDMAGILRAALPAIGGRGGGAPHLAQGGGTHPEGLATALDIAYGQVMRLLGGEL